MSLPERLRVKIGTFATLPEISATTSHHFRVEEPERVLHQATSEETLFSVPEVRIGIDFHWDRRINLLLPDTVEALRNTDGSWDLFNILPLETYLKSVVSSEMNPQAPMEFLKAHAIISRSWVVANILKRSAPADSGITDPYVVYEDREAHTDCDVCADDHCQRFQGMADLNERALEAVTATSGVILLDSAGEVADARFSKCCGGSTELFSTCWQERDYDYLQHVECPYCDLTGMEPAERDLFLGRVLKAYDRESTPDFNRWEADVDPAFVAEGLQSRFGVNVGEVTGLEPVERGPSGRIKLLRIKGDQGEVTVGKELAIRRLLSPTTLYSSAFEVDGMHLRGRGWGHGVGLCQIGAARMAEQGADYREILRHYFPHTTLSAPTRRQG